MCASVWHAVHEIGLSTLIHHNTITTQRDFYVSITTQHGIYVCVCMIRSMWHVPEHTTLVHHNTITTHHDIYVCVCVIRSTWHRSQYTNTSQHNHNTPRYLCVRLYDAQYMTYALVPPQHITTHHSTITIQSPYGVATMSRLLKIIGLFCKRAL